MAREIPEVVRAAAGLAATVLDEARKLPETLPGLPVRVIGLAMQQAMKIQQQYAGFVARGDELFTGLRGEDEPGLATFDDEIEEAGNGVAPGYRESAFDRADIPLTEVHVDDEEPPSAAPVAEPVAAAPATARAAAKPARKKAKAEKRAKAGARKPGREAAAPAAEVGQEVEEAQQTLDALPAEAPATQEVLEELAIDEMVGDAPLAGPVASTDTASTDTASTDTASAEAASADVATTVDVLTPGGEVAEVEATVTDEGVAAPETPAPAATEAPATEAPAAETPAAEPPAAEAPAPAEETSSAPAAAPVDGYDSFSVAQLRGRLRGYALSTVDELVAYEQATRAREPYLRMLRNRLEKLEAQAVESSPLAPRGA